MPGGKKGVLLIHGFTGLPAELLLMGEFLNKQGFTVLGVRLAGHGTTVEDMSHMTWEDWMDSVRDGYALLSGYCEDISVIGHSMGGLFALLLSTEEIVSHGRHGRFSAFSSFSFSISLVFSSLNLSISSSYCCLYRCARFTARSYCFK